MAVEGPFSSDHILYTFLGSLPGGEIWSCGLRTEAADPTIPQLQDAATNAGVAFAKMWNASGSFKGYNPSAVTLDSVTARAVGTDGKTVAQAVALVAGVVGNSGQQTAPNQTALVVTLLTNRAGRSGKGRIYMPFLTPSFTTVNDRIPALAIQPLVDAMGVFIHDVGSQGTSGGGPWAVAVQSRVVTGAAPPVSSVSIGDVCDTQRRRRDKVKENYITGPVVPPVVP